MVCCTPRDETVVFDLEDGGRGNIVFPFPCLAGMAVGCDSGDKGMGW